VPADFSRFGKIFQPGGQPPYPFRLSMPGPGFGEVKVPSKDELDSREKLERLAELSDAEIRDRLEKWPAFSKMSLSDEGTMLMRIQQFREFRTKVAAMKARQIGLLTLTPEQQARFEKEYWNRWIQMDRQLAQQFEPVYKASEEKLDEDLFREFSSPASLAQKPKPSSPPAPAMVNAPPSSSAVPSTMMMH
jgi:hypothetical protein